MTEPKTQLPKLPSGAQFVSDSWAASVVPRRSFGTHKWEVGGLLVVGGAPEYVGAPALAALGAMRAGAGVVTLAVSRGAVPTLAGLVPEATFLPLPEGESMATVNRAADLIGERLDRYRAAVIGCGLGRDEFAEGLVAALLTGSRSSGTSRPGFGRKTEESSVSTPVLAGRLPAVLDADALSWLAEQPDWWKSFAPQTLVLTPHAGEFARLTNHAPEAFSSDPISAAIEAASKWNQVVVLKSGYACATDGKSTLVADDAPVSLATAGAGDVLAGVIGSNVAEGMSLLDAAGLALWAGTRAARVCEATYGQRGVTARDLPVAYAQALAKLDTQGDS